MKKIFTCLLMFLCISFYGNAQRELVLCTTGYGFDHNSSNGLDAGIWTYIQKWANLSYNGQDAGVTAVRLHIQWQQYEPTPGNYQAAKLATAIQTILSVKPGMKVALHFPYQREGPQPGQSADPYFAEDEIARIPDGTKVQQTITFTIPSIYSSSASTKFYDFVNSAMNAVSAYYSNILYVQMGNGSAEEYIMPIFEKNGYHYPGMYEDAALQAWRTQYLPCRYPGQSNVTWDGNTYAISSAPSAFPGEWNSWTSEHAKEYHRFASWGLMKFYKGFRDVVKSKSSSLKVLMFIPGFGTTAGNLQSMHNSMLPMSMNEFDGMYVSEGVDLGDTWRKIMVPDVLKGTNPNKIAAIEFDPVDMGQQSNPTVPGIYPGVAADWIPRAFKHGVDYVHFAMAYYDSEIDQLAPVLASIKATYINSSYTPPSRQPAVNTNIYPTSFTGTFLFDDPWKNQGADNWSVTDLSPKSVNMTDSGYWENIWSCSSQPSPCDFNMTASASPTNPTAGASVTLSSSCTGSACSGLTYSWSGNGISGTNSSVTFNAPATAGTYTYTVTVSKSGCSNKTANVQITVGATTCDFNVSASVTPSSVTTGASTQLTYTCSGTNCSGVTYAWSGNGVSGSTSPLSITAPGTAGTYTYTITASKSGCTDKTANTTLTVTSGGGSLDQCVEAENSSGTGAITSDPNASNGDTRGEQGDYNHYVDYVITGVPSAGNYTATLTYSSSAAPTVAVSVNGGSATTINLANSGSWNIVFTTQSFTVALSAGTNTIRIAGTGGGSCRQDKLCVVGSGGGCSTPSAPSLSASPSSITSGNSSTLSASGCSGGTITWSDGLGTGTSKTVSPTADKTYTATCSIGGCTSSEASVTVTVTQSGGPFSQCLEAENSSGTGAITSDPNASNGDTRGEQGDYNHYVDYAVTGVPSAGTYNVTLTYSSSAAPTVAVSVNGGSATTINLANSGSWNIVFTTYTFSVNLGAGSNTIRIAGTGGGSCRQDKICVANGSSSVLGADPEELSAAIRKPMIVSPNPNNGVFETQFYLEKGKKAVIIVTDLQGRTIHRQSVSGQGLHREKINLNNKASGMLFLQLQKDNAVEIKKISIIR